MFGKRLTNTVIGAVLMAAVITLVLVPITSARSAPGRQSPLTASEARALSEHVTDRVIVVFKNQLSSIPDTPALRARRASAVAGVQSPVVSELSVTHATHVKRFQLINAVAAYVSAGEAKRLQANPAVAEVVPDTRISAVSTPPLTVPQRNAHGAGSGGSLAQACAPPGQVQLNPQAIEQIHAAEPAGDGPSAQSLGYTGAGVKVGFIADGLDIDNPDFVRANGQHVFVDYQDFSGTGTSAPTDGGEAFLDASSIAAQGREVYNVADYGAGLSKPCDIRVLGTAPGASLVGLNVFGSSNFAYNSVFVEAINYAVNVDHVNVLNESFGANPFPDQASLDLIRMADEAAAAAGVTVTVSTGDAGVTDTIGEPSTDPAVISAGASTTYRAYAQTGIGGITYPTVNGWLNNNISALSGAGFDQAGQTVDVVAPGDLNWALCSPYPQLYAACTTFSGQPSSVELQGGTSEAAPLTAGTAALVIQAYEENHGGNAPTPAQVKQIIMSTAQDISAPGEQQGAGILDAYAAVQAAAAYPGGHSAGAGAGQATSHALLKSATQLNAVGPAGAPEYFSEMVTNDGSTAQAVQVSSRTLSAYQQVAHTTVQLADATGDQATVTFNVAPGQARLNASIAYVGTTAAQNLSLISPSGKLAEYSLPQGIGNYGNTQVANPEPGKWTALIFGFAGPVQFAASTARWVPFGQLSTNYLSLGPGATRTISLAVRNPQAPGDQAGSIVFTSLSNQPGFAATTTVPVTLRALVPTPNPTTTFTGTLTGGNGRQANTGQTAYYQVYVPLGVSELNASVSSPNSANTFMAELIDPVTGEAASTASSEIPGSGGSLVPENGDQLHVLHPNAGVWTIAIDFYNQVSGTAIAQPFTVTLSRTPVPVVSALPDSARTTLAAGAAKTVPVKVTNTGSTPEAYFVDARLNQSEQLPLSALTSSQTTVPISTETVPMYVVPTHTTSITATATAPAPIYFDYWWSFGDPDIFSSTGDTATGTFTDNPVVAGEWGITPFQKGPDGAHGVTPVTADTGITATTAAFDPAVTSSTGDFWRQAINASAPVNPVVVGPGQSATIPVTITPSGSSGSVVNGTLYVDDLTIISGEATWNELGVVNIDQASELAAIPYEYTIG
jgi:hypothetical protein